jgi:hypothetical protein
VASPEKAQKSRKSLLQKLKKKVTMERNALFARDEAIRREDEEEFEEAVALFQDPNEGDEGVGNEVEEGEDEEDGDEEDGDEEDGDEVDGDEEDGDEVDDDEEDGDEEGEAGDETNEATNVEEGTATNYAQRTTEESPAAPDGPMQVELGSSDAQHGAIAEAGQEAARGAGTSGKGDCLQSVAPTLMRCLTAAAAPGVMQGLEAASVIAADSPGFGARSSSPQLFHEEIEGEIHR